MSSTIENERFRNLLDAYPVKAIEYLYEHYYEQLFRLAAWLTRNEHQAQDILQDVFLHIWKNHKALSKQHEQPILHYMIRAVRNLSMTYFNKIQRFNEFQNRYLNGHSFSIHEEAIENKIIDREIKQEVRNFIATFPRRERECLLMKIDQELTPQQIADRLKVSRKAVERSLTSGKKRLQKCWQTKYGGNSENNSP